MSDYNTNRTRQEASNKVIEALASFGVTALTHPLSYVKVLAQVGHEPFEPTKSTAWLSGKTVYYSPNVLRYANYIRVSDGWSGLYVGLGPKLIQRFICTHTTNAVKNFLTQDCCQEGDVCEGPVEGEEMQNYVKETANIVLAKSVGIIVSHPFHVISIRMMLQFIGKETYYSGIVSSIKEIYQQEGLLGFFSGLVPVMVGEILTLLLVRALSYTLDKNMPSFTELLPEGTDSSIKKFIPQYSPSPAPFIASWLTYPFTVVGTMMVANGSRLTGGLAYPPRSMLFDNWVHCYSYLRQRGLLSRGSSNFWRPYISVCLL